MRRFLIRWFRRAAAWLERPLRAPGAADFTQALIDEHCRLEGELRVPPGHAEAMSRVYGDNVDGIMVPSRESRLLAAEIRAHHPEYRRPTRFSRRLKAVK